MKGLFVVDNYANLKAARLIAASAVMLSQIGDISPPKSIIMAQTLIFHYCDKNFVYYFMIMGMHRDLKHLVLASHPCEPVIVRRMFDMKHVRIQIHEQFWGTTVRYGDIGPHMTKITDADYQKLINSFD